MTFSTEIAEDIEEFKSLVENNDGWLSRYNKHGIRVFTKLSDESRIKIIKVRTEFKDISLDVMYDLLHDDGYRKIWDENMIEGKDICKLDDSSAIGYYAVRMPSPLRNRDFVTKRRWVKLEKEFSIFNHSVQHKKLEAKKPYIRAISLRTGYHGVANQSGCGCFLTFISQTDPKGKLPKWMVNRVACKVTPKVVNKLYKAAKGYEEWKSTNKPDWKPWLKPEQCPLPLVDMNDMKLSEDISSVLDEYEDIDDFDEIDESNAVELE